MKDHIDEEIERIIDDAPVTGVEAYERVQAAMADPVSCGGSIHLASGEEAEKFMEMIFADAGEDIPEDMREFFRTPPTQKEDS